MSSLVSTISELLSLFTIAVQMVIVCLLVAVIFKNKSVSRKVFEFVNKKILTLGFLISLGALLASLFYSEIAGFPPCSLCWYQRVLIYPQVVLFGLALVRKEKLIINYVLVLSALGALIAAYQYYLQLGGPSLVPCSAAESAVSCLKIYTLNFGYITIPLMAFSIFLLLAVLILAAKTGDKKNPAQ